MDITEANEFLNELREKYDSTHVEYPLDQNLLKTLKLVPKEYTSHADDFDPDINLEGKVVDAVLIARKVRLYAGSEQGFVLEAYGYVLGPDDKVWIEFLSESKYPYLVASQWWPLTQNRADDLYSNIETAVKHLDGA